MSSSSGASTVDRQEALDVLDTPAAGVAAIRGGVLRATGYFAGVGTGVLSSALLLRHLGVAQSGEYITVISLVSLALGVSDAGISTIGIHELSTLRAGDSRHVFKSLLGLRLVLAGAGVLVAIVFGLLASYSSTRMLGALLASCGFAIAGWQLIYAVPLLAEMRLSLVAALEVLRQAGTAATIVALVLVGAPLLPFWAAPIPAGVVATVIGAIAIRNTAPLLPAFDSAIWISLIRKALPFAVATAVGVIYFRIAILVLSSVASARQTGYYAASFRVVEVIFVLPQLIVGSMLPIFSRAARDDRARLDRVLGKTLDVCLLIGLAVGLALICGAPFIVHVVAGPRFGPAAPVLRVQGAALIATFVGAALSYGLLSLRSYRPLLLINLAVLLLSAALTAVLGARFGAIGAAVATAIVELLYTALLAVALLRAGARPAISAGSAVGATLAALAGTLALVPTGVPAIARPLVALALYGVATMLLGVLPDEVLNQLPVLRRCRNR
jgi:O-antigen/teichoic acid export membrane protein